MESLLPTDRTEYIAYYDFYRQNREKLNTVGFTRNAERLACFKAGIEYAKKIERAQVDLERLEMNLGILERTSD